MTVASRYRPRRVIRLLHRDVGYILFALTTMYAISGVAVNHMRDWNPNYAVTRTAIAIGPLEAIDLDGMEAEVVAKLGIDASEVTGRHRPGPEAFVLFLPEGGEVRLDVATGVGEMERLRQRPILFASNLLHLNRVRGSWTLVADVFALLLLFLAVSGLFMLKGRAGLAGRGKWLVAVGTAVPIIFLVHHYRGP